MCPGGKSATGLTGTNPAMAIVLCLLSVRLAQVEPEQLGGVVHGDLTPIRLENSGKDPVQEGAGLWPRRFGVREVIAPQHRIHANDLAQAHTEFVLYELDEHITMPVVTREQALS